MINGAASEPFAVNVTIPKANAGVFAHLDLWIEGLDQPVNADFEVLFEVPAAPAP